MLIAHPTNTSKYFRLSSAVPSASMHHMMMLESGALRFLLNEFLCSFRPRKTKKKPKKRSVDGQHQPNEFLYPRTNTPPSSCEFSCDHSHTHHQRLRNFQPTPALIVHIDCNCKRKRSSMLIMTCVWEFVGVVWWCSIWNMFTWCIDVSDNSKDRRTQNCYKNFVRFWCVECDVAGCVCDFEMTVNFRRVTTHIFRDSHRSARPVYLSVYVFFLLFAFAVFLLPFTKKKHKIHFFHFLGCDFFEIFFGSRCFVYVRRRTHLMLAAFLLFGFLINFGFFPLWLWLFLSLISWKDLFCVKKDSNWKCLCLDRGPASVIQLMQIL